VSPLAMPFASRVIPVFGLGASSGPEKTVPWALRKNHDSWRLVCLAMVVWSIAMVEFTGISMGNVLSRFFLGGFCARSRGGLMRSLMMAWDSCDAVWSAAGGTGEAWTVSPRSVS
jgi:hypothetical protein